MFGIAQNVLCVRTFLELNPSALKCHCHKIHSAHSNITRYPVELFLIKVIRHWSAHLHHHEVLLHAVVEGAKSG